MHIHSQSDTNARSARHSVVWHRRRHPSSVPNITWNEKRYTHFVDSGARLKACSAHKRRRYWCEMRRVGLFYVRTLFGCPTLHVIAFAHEHWRTARVHGLALNPRPQQHYTHTHTLCWSQRWAWSRAAKAAINDRHMHNKWPSAFLLILNISNYEHFVFINKWIWDWWITVLMGLRTVSAAARQRHFAKHDAQSAATMQCDSRQSHNFHH